MRGKSCMIMSRHGSCVVCLFSQPPAVPATDDAKHPYANLVAVSMSEDLKLFYFATSRKTHKYRNLKQNPNVSLLLDSRTNTTEDFKQAVVATAVGQAAEIDAHDAEQVRLIHVKRHPPLETFVLEPECAFFQVAVQKYIVVNSFQNVTELPVE